MSGEINKEFHGYLKQACESTLVSQTVDPRRVFYLRPSALPLCSLRNFLDYAKNGIAKTRDVPAAGLYYTSTGANTHLVFQAIVGKGGRVVGNWICPKCKFERKLSTYKVCDKCQSSMLYEEVEVSFGAWRGHLDNIYIAKNKELWIVDYKTCTAKFIHQKNYGPSQSYVEQQNHYVVLLEEKLQRKIAGWMLVFLARENPIKLQRIVSRRLREETKDKMRKENHLYSKLHKKIWKIESVAEVKPLYEHKRCRDKQEHDRVFRFDECSYVKVCFNRSSMVEKTKQIVNGSKHLPLIKYMPENIKEDLYDR